MIFPHPSSRCATDDFASIGYAWAPQYFVACEGKCQDSMPQWPVEGGVTCSVRKTEHAAADSPGAAVRNPPIKIQPVPPDTRSHAVRCCRWPRPIVALRQSLGKIACHGATHRGKAILQRKIDREM